MTPSQANLSIVANGVKIIGSMIAEGAEVQVDGEIEGNIHGGSLAIGETGMVRGDILAESVTVKGRVEGSVRARKVRLERNAHVLGDIIHQSLSVEMGAVFEGQCRYLQDPLQPDAGGGEPVAPQQIQGPSPFGGAPEGGQQQQDGDRLPQGVVVSGNTN